MGTRESLARTYYRSIDEGEYETLASILAPSFVHERPDRTLAGPEQFVRFMREDRPRTDTTHAVDGVYADDSEVAVRGRLLGDTETDDRDRLFGFVDVFAFEDGAISRLRTYTR